MMSYKIGSVILLTSIFLTGIVMESSAQVTLRDIGVLNSADQPQMPLYKTEVEDSADLKLNVDFHSVQSNSPYGILGAVPFENGMARVGNFTINKNVETTAVILLKAFVLPNSLDYPMHTNFNTLDFQYALPAGSPQLKLKIGN